MRATEILEQIENTSGKNAKRAILMEHRGNKDLDLLLNAALSYKRRFNIKKFQTESELQASEICIGRDVSDLMEVLALLENRKIVGNEAKQHVDWFISGCNPLDAKWYSRVIKKNLRAGFSAETAAKCGYNVPIFDVQLAKDGKKCKKLKEIVEKGVYLSPKLDGYRMLVFVEDGNVSLLSRDGTEYENFPQIKELIESSPIIRKLNYTWILDGEMMSDDFNAMQQSAMSSKSGKQVGDLVYNVFDAIPYHEFTTGKFKMNATQRYETVTSFVNEINSPLVIEVDHGELCHDLDEALQYEKDCIAAGYEGAMINPDIPYYVGKKSNKMMKLKTMITDDVEVVKVYRGDPDGKYADTMGGITVRQTNGVLCDCGSGFTDADRDYMWAHPDEFIGETCEVAYDSLSVDDQRMRFPIFKRWRKDK